MQAQLTQDSLIEALRALRQDHPELPDISWEINPYCQSGLRGHAFSPDRDLQVLEAYAVVIGGVIKAAHCFTCQQGDMQSFVLRGQWADVPFVLTGSVSVAAYAEYQRTHLAVTA